MLPKCITVGVLITVALVTAAIHQLQAEWIENGVPVCTEALNQVNAQVVTDGAGGSIIVWEDRRTESNGGDIYAQRLDADGNPLWAAGGVGICTEAGAQGNPRIIASVAGGAIIVWVRVQGIDSDIFAQRIDSTGTIYWTAGGVEVGNPTHDRYDPHLVPDGDHGAIIAWVDDDFGKDIYAQRLDKYGVKQWGGMNVDICDASGTQEDIDIVSDGAGGAIITWEDDRSGFDIAAQRVNGSGTTLWTEDGIVVCDPDDYAIHPRIATDGDGGAIITWEGPRQPGHTQTDIYAQRVDDSGSVLWGADGLKICSGWQDQNHPVIVSDNEGGAIIVWEDARNSDDDVYAQRVNGSGTALWTADGIAVCVESGLQQTVRIAADENGGVYIVWEDYRSGGADVYAQRVDGLGNTIWAADGLAVSSAANDQLNPAVTTDGAGNAVIAWEHYDDSSGYDIYALGIDPNGYPGDNDPAIGVVRDVPHDNGGWVTVTWPHAPLDAYHHEIVTHYAVWRKYGAGNWELMTYMDAYYRDYYTYTSPTLEDSSTAGAAYHHFKIIAHTENELMYWESPPDSGYSVDNFALPGSFLAQNYPNPFNPSTTIHFGLKRAGHVTLTVYDAAGRPVRALVDERREAENYIETWNGMDEAGRPAQSGVYFYKLDAGIFMKTKKMVLLR